VASFNLVPLMYTQQ